MPTSDFDYKRAQTIAAVRDEILKLASAGYKEQCTEPETVTVNRDADTSYNGAGELIDGVMFQVFGASGDSREDSERQRIRDLLPTFRDDNVSQRRDTELRRIARNALLDELGAWIDGGARAYEPKD